MHSENIEKIRKEGEESLAALTSSSSLLAWETEYLGRKGKLTAQLKLLKDLPPEEKKIAGALANAAKVALQEALAAKKDALASREINWTEEAIDVTIPSLKAGEKTGHLHPITIVENRVGDIFQSLGFALADGPEAETEWYNFDALNVPADHPARDMQDTFWLKKRGKNPERFLLRTHTSNVQVRYMQTHKPPFRIIIPGRIFRNEATDASHEHTFHQFECLMVDKSINVAHFKYLAQVFFEEFFEQKIEIRLRPSFFPFTEPSFEFDISCILCAKKGCSVCKQSGWLEIGGAGMVNQKVFEAAGYKRGEYQGFAWGFGLTRLAMMKYKIPEIRLFMSGDLRFTRQFTP